jgi:enoyl-CoA hydratase/carnithine racemase
MKFETLLVDIQDGGVALVTLNRPEVLNAMNRAMVNDLNAALEALNGNADARVVVITGSGMRAFTAGGDIHEMTNQGSDEAFKFQQSVTECAWSLANYRLPTIAAVNGLAYGGGAALAVSADIRIGCERTRFRFLGAQYGRLNSTWSLPVIVGWPHARELIFSSRVVEAEESLRMGLLNHLVPAADVVSRAMSLAGEIARNPPDMVQGAKKLMNDFIGESWPRMVDAERHAVRTTLQPGTVEESFAEFLDRKNAK